MNRYLATASGGRVGSRALPTFMTCGPLTLMLLLFAAGIVLLQDLVAEANGDFGEAVELFRLAEGALPAAAAPARKSYVRSMGLAHIGLCLLGAGRLEEARAALDQAQRELGGMFDSGMMNALLDDHSWGLGNVSLNSVLMGMELNRDPRGVLALAWALHDFRRGARSEAAARIAHEAPLCARSWLPRETELAQALSGAPPTGWAARLLG